MARAATRFLPKPPRPAHDYLAEVCEEWEREATAAEALGVRVAKIRIGIALGKEGGALEKMLPPFRAFVGGKIASGKQWMSWIHVDDVVGIVCHALENPVSGVFNATSPNPVTNERFTSELSQRNPPARAISRACVCAES